MILFMLIPGTLLGMFISNATPEETAIMLSIGRPALRIICIHFIMAGVVISFNSIFQALGKGIYAMITSICRQLVILLPAAYILARIGFSIGNDNLVWISFPIAEVASMIVGIIFFLRINKKLISRVKDTDETPAIA